MEIVWMPAIGLSSSGRVGTQTGKGVYPCAAVLAEKGEDLERAGLLHELRRVAHECVLLPGTLESSRYICT